MERQRKLEEQRRGEQLKEDAARWHECKRLREYIAAVEEKQVAVDPERSLDEWVEWANAVADQLDPIAAPD